MAKMTFGPMDLYLSVIWLMQKSLLHHLLQKTRYEREQLQSELDCEFAIPYRHDAPVPKGFCRHHFDHRDCLDCFLHQRHPLVSHNAQLGPDPILETSEEEAGNGGEYQGGESE